MPCMLVTDANKALQSSNLLVELPRKVAQSQSKLFPSLSPSEVFNHLEEMQEFLTVRAVMKETAVSAQ